MDTEAMELTTSLVNVRLPILPGKWSAATFARLNDFFEDTLHRQFKTAIPIYAHNNKLWARFSAQVWLEVSDFEYGARCLLELCRRVNEGDLV